MHPLLRWKGSTCYIIWVRVWSLRYPAYNAHAPYILSSVACLALQCFSTLSHKRYDFRKKKKVTEHKTGGPIFYTSFVWNISHSYNYWSKDAQKCVLVLNLSTCYCCPSLMKLELPRKIFEKYANTKFHANPPSGSGVFFFADRRKNSHDEDRSGISPFRLKIWDLGTHSITRSFHTRCGQQASLHVSEGLYTATRPIPFYILTYFMQQSPSWEANRVCS